MCKEMRHFLPGPHSCLCSQEPERLSGLQAKEVLWGDEEIIIVIVSGSGSGGSGSCSGGGGADMYLWRKKLNIGA